MNKDLDIEIKKLLLNNEDIEVPSAISQGIDDTLFKLEQQESYQGSNISTIRSNKWPGIRKIVRVAIITLALMVTAFSVNIYAKDNPIKQFINAAVEKITSNSSNAIKDFTNYKNSDIDSYKTVIEQSVSYNGITISLNEVVLDENQLLMAYTVTQDKVDFSKTSFPYTRLYINGKEVRIGSGGSHMDVDKHTRRYIESKDVDTANMDDNVEIKIVFEKRHGYSPQDEIWNGKWEFIFNASKEKLMSSTRRIAINKTLSLPDNGSVTIKNITITPISTSINSTSECVDKERKGNNIIEVDYALYDEKGNKVDPVSIHHRNRSVDEKILGESYHRFVKLEDSIVKLKIVPYASKYSMDSNYNKELKQQAIEIELK
ncbi:DUF4179 domain-containing protein [Desnuesiella massiliensis]|uniref:DUF4179 domain-containing protein n=1 Tax=Desnuesiella massiliensis TaxID=1650662 RepID=UPI0006E315FD|nr:DUF4179 domain-containing protein [Desnuesiella massiliensis]